MASVFRRMQIQTGFEPSIPLPVYTRVTERDGLVSEQQRLRGELSMANAQLAIDQEETAVVRAFRAWVSASPPSRRRSRTIHSAGEAWRGEGRVARGASDV